MINFDGRELLIEPSEIESVRCRDREKKPMQIMKILAQFIYGLMDSLLSLLDSCCCYHKLIYYQLLLYQYKHVFIPRSHVHAKYGGRKFGNEQNPFVIDFNQDLSLHIDPRQNVNCISLTKWHLVIDGSKRSVRNKIGQKMQW